MNSNLIALCEAAKAAEYSKDGNSLTEIKKFKKKDSNSLTNRETHNFLEKNRRAELKNYFQRLKESVPKLQGKSKASNVSILIEAEKYIQDLNKIDKDYEDEVLRLRRCKLCLEERIKMLKEEIQRQALQKSLFNQVDEERKRPVTPLSTANSRNTTTTTTTKTCDSVTSQPKETMRSVEVQANEADILAAFPVQVENDEKPEETKKVNVLNSVEVQVNENNIHSTTPNYVKSSPETILTTTSSTLKSKLPVMESLSGKVTLEGTVITIIKDNEESGDELKIDLDS